MKRIITILTVMIMAVSFSYGDVCGDMKDQAKDLYSKCKSMKKGSGEYKQCASSYKILKRKVKTACQGGMGKDKITKAINQWKGLVKKCKGKKNTRCASALQQLGHYTYKYEELLHLEKMASYDEETVWCDDRDNKPAKCASLQPPKADHSRSLKHFVDYIEKYPKSSKTPNVIFQTSFIYEVAGEEKRAYDLRKKLVKDFPDHGLVPKAWLRIGEYYFLERKYKEAIDAYDKVTGFNTLTGKEAALALYHKAESYYNRADYQAAAEGYYGYIYGSDNNKYPSDLRGEAMDFMAASFADMDDGVIEAGKFLKGKKVSFKDSLYFRIGMKNKDHDRNPEAVQAFRYLLDINPDYVDAPLADIAMISILITQQKFEEAQKERLRVVTAYDKNSSWYRVNRNNKKSVESAMAAIRSCMLDIPQYHHAEAAKITKSGDIEAGKKEYKKAADAYNAFLRKYPEPSWDEYKVHINMAIIYNDLGQFARAAKEFNWVGDADTVKYGRRPQHYGELLKKQDAAYNAVLAMDQDRALALKNKAGGDPEKGYSLPQTKAYFAQVDRYMRKWGKQKEAAELAYNASLVHYEAKQYKTAVGSLKKLRKDFPDHKYTLMISRMLAQSQLEAGLLEDSHKEFEWLLAQYKTARNDSMQVEINKSIAAVLFQKASQDVKKGKHAQGAKGFLALTDRFPTAEFADKAIFEAGAAYESGKQYEEAAKTFMLMPRKYAKSKLTVKSILRAASAYKKAKMPRDAARTFLFVTDNFPQDSMAFAAIGFAAATYDSIPDKKMAAQTFELAQKRFPKNKKTPSFLYNACLTYDEAKLTEEAIRCSKLLVSDYKKSSYALDAAFSIPIAYKNAKKWDLAAQAYLDFAKEFKDDKAKLIAAYLGAAHSFVELKKEDAADEQYENVLKAYDKYGLQINADPGVPAEAAYMRGEYAQKEMDPIILKGNAKAKAKSTAELTKKLQVAMSLYAKSASYVSEKWTFRATNKMGMLFVVMSAKIRDQELSSKKKDEQFAERIGIVQQLPTFYEQAKPIFEKNIQLAREQGFYNKDVIEAEQGYVEMFYRDCATFFEVADAFRNSPRPPWDQICRAEGLGKEDCEDQKVAYDSEIEEKAQTAEDGAVPKCETAIKASAHYQIDNDWTEKARQAIKNVNPDHAALKISITKFDPTTLFKDPKYFKTKARIEQIASSKVMTGAEQLKTYESIIEESKKDNIKLTKQLEKLRAKIAPPPAAAGPGGVQ